MLLTNTEVGIIIGLFGIIVSIFIYLLQRKKKRNKGYVNFHLKFNPQNHSLTECEYESEGYSDGELTIEKEKCNFKWFHKMEKNNDE